MGETVIKDGVPMDLMAAVLEKIMEKGARRK
jgi:hypothetical protein